MGEGDESYFGKGEDLGEGRWKKLWEGDGDREEFIGRCKGGGGGAGGAGGRVY